MTKIGDRTHPASLSDTLEKAIHLARTGQKLEARDMLRRVVAIQPVNQAAWLWLSALASDRTEAEAALTQARKINPTHHSLLQAEQWFVNRFSAQPLTQKTRVIVTPSSSSLPTSSSQFPNPGELFYKAAFGLIALAILIGLGVLLLGLGLEINATAQARQFIQNQSPGSENKFSLEDYSQELNTAWVEQDWTTVIAILEKVHLAEPDLPAITTQLSHAYLQKGVVLRHKGFIKEAMPFFEKALALTPDQPQPQQEFELASNYLQGIEKYQAGRWQETIIALEAVWAEDKDYVNIQDLLYSAYYNHGLALQAAGELSMARDALEAATNLRPDLPEPYLARARIEFDLTTGTPPPIPLSPSSSQDKKIIVGIAEQRMLVYEGKEQIFDFVVSTGEPGRDTALGNFEILDKIDVAYASTWNLDMPYWMGIYWSGPLQNGIHALPIVKHTGYKLWDGYLGQRVSYGCIILSDEDAATLYNWADIGTQVKIVSGLTNWTPED